MVRLIVHAKNYFFLLSHTEIWNFLSFYYILKWKSLGWADRTRHLKHRRLWETGMEITFYIFHRHYQSFINENNQCGQHLAWLFLALLSCKQKIREKRTETRCGQHGPKRAEHLKVKWWKITEKSWEQRKRAGPRASCWAVMALGHLWWGLLLGVPTFGTEKRK